MKLFRIRIQLTWAAILFGTTVLFAATPRSETAQVVRTGEHVRIFVDTYRPLRSVAVALADHFGLSVSVEDPLWTYTGDLLDASLETARLRAGTMVPRGGTLEVEFATKDPERIMMAVLEAANSQLNFQYRLDKDGGQYRLVPVRGRNAQGEMTDITPLLDRLVSIPFGTREVAASAGLMAAELGRQTGLNVSCCQSFVAGIPWGLDKAPFGAERQRARDVLKALAELQPGSPKRWFASCDLQFCFIDIR